MKMDALRFVGRTTVDFPMTGAAASGPFVLKGADGLGAPDFTVKMAKTVFEKAVFQGKTPTLRQITAVVALQPDWNTGQTPEDLRTMLYNLITTRSNGLLQVQVMYQGDVQAFAQGQISKMVPALFSKDPAVQIIVDCDYGYLLDTDTITQTPAQYDFPIASRAFDVENIGTAPSGFVMSATLRANVGTTLKLTTDDPSDMKIQIDGINWVSGDNFKVDTRPGSRGVWRGAAGGAYASCLNNLNASVSEWMYLYPGTNTLVLNTTDFDWESSANFTHLPAYQGV